MRDEQKIWSEVLSAHEAVASANERLRRALTRMDIFLDQRPEVFDPTDPTSRLYENEIDK